MTTSLSTVPGDAAVVVRAATHTELAAAGATVRSAYQADGLGDGDGEYLDVVADAARRSRDALVLVAVVGVRVLGSVTYARHGSPWAEVCGPGEAEFRMLGVAPPSRGLGVGEALVQSCLQQARRDGAAALALSADTRSVAAHRLYERLGFRRRQQLDWSPVPGVDLLGYRLELTPPGPAGAAPR